MANCILQESEEKKAWHEYHHSSWRKGDAEQSWKKLKTRRVGTTAVNRTEKDEGSMGYAFSTRTSLRRGEVEKTTRRSRVRGMQDCKNT